MAHMRGASISSVHVIEAREEGVFQSAGKAGTRDPVVQHENIYHSRPIYRSTA